MPLNGRGVWRMNSALLEDEEVRRSFEEFLQAQATILDFCGSKLEWWEFTKVWIGRFFKALGKRKQLEKYIAYQQLRRKLDRLVSEGGDSGAISEVKLLLKKYQYDRCASLVLERDYGKHHSPNLFQNCKRSIAIKTISGLRDSTGSLTKSRSGILEVSRAFFEDLLKEKHLDRAGMSSFLDSTPGLENNNPSTSLTSEDNS
ncbi:unnamed protein product [Staurois parvus]|uniref:Uncharacterized protein n=1 Tax=Staurois parvus TaxID=386267 RepID=A0ABN9FLT6_9NEOB|nr:unnamed protein product [Staurois parvus]